MHVARFWRNRKLRYQLVRHVVRPELEVAEARPVSKTTVSRRRDDKSVKVMVA